MTWRFAVVLAVLGSVALSPARAEGTKPNFVVFLSDDHGQRDSEPYGARDIRTPNLKALAASGCLFTHMFVVTPSCAPSRAAILTGLNPARNGAESNHTFKKEGIASLPDALRALGYETAAFGKVAHGPNDPKRHGFDHIDRRLDRATIAAFLKGRDPSKSLTLFVGTHEPHVPWAEHADYDPKTVTVPPTHVDTPETREYHARYYTDITRADTQLGDVRALAKERLGANTLFVYMSDHGAQWPFGKWNLYDAGIRVPFLVEWPGVISPGSTSDAMLASIDLLPTLIELAGGTPPKGIDGRSFAAVLRGQSMTHRDRVFATHANDGDWNVYPIRALRTRRYKYIRNLHPEFPHTTHIDQAEDRDGLYYWRSWKKAARTDPAAAAIVRRYHERPAEELYDLQADPFEQTNLAGDPSQARRLASRRADLDAWMARQGDTGRFSGKPHRRARPDADDRPNSARP